jgi:hypothetical protein
MTKTVPTNEGLTFLVAEDSREEVGGKFTLMGYAPGGDLIVQVGAEGASPKMLLSSLCLFCSFTDGIGKFAMTVTLLDPSGKNVMGDLKQEVEKKPEGALTINLNLKPFAFSFGKYRLIIALDDTPYERTFSIRDSRS